MHKKKLSDADLGWGTSHQTHIGLHEDMLSDWSSDDKIYDAYLFVDNIDHCYNCQAVINAIVDGETKNVRSPKIKTGNIEQSSNLLKLIRIKATPKIRYLTLGELPDGKLFAFLGKDNSSISEIIDSIPSIIEPRSSNADVIIPKPFLLLAGISGTGKTRFVRAQAVRSNGWSADDTRKPDNYELVSVRPDWHEPSDLLGYVSRIDGTNYIPTGFLKFLVRAWQEVFNKGGSLTNVREGTRPFWLCLDEMNLAPVEQYFADYLSILETRKWEKNKYSSLPILRDNLELVMEALGGKLNDDLWRAFIANEGIPLPPNLIVAGTVNMDETTHGFSRKVIDRALTLDFQEFFPNIFEDFFNPATEPKLIGYSVASQITSKNDLSDVNADNDGSLSINFLSKVNDVLKSTPFELAYRALNELLLSVKCFKPDNNRTLVAVWDDFLMQKVLPRIDGDAEKLHYTREEERGLLNELSELITTEFKTVLKITDDIPITRPDLLNKKVGGGNADDCTCKSLEKIAWMQKRLVDNQYTSFWA